MRERHLLTKRSAVPRRARLRGALKRRTSSACQSAPSNGGSLRVNSPPNRHVRLAEWIHTVIHQTRGCQGKREC